MKVKILVEFEIEGLEDDDELTGNVAKSAASIAAWNNLVMTHNGMDFVERVTVHVDGFGECQVKIGEDHE